MPRRHRRIQIARRRFSRSIIAWLWGLVQRARCPPGMITRGASDVTPAAADPPVIEVCEMRYFLR
jgi:hypothetical protein